MAFTRLAAGAVLTMTGAALAGCAHTEADAASPPSCAATVSTALQGIAHHVIDEAAGGRDVTGSAAAIARSPALAEAVRHDDHAAVLTALRPLLRSRVQRIVITGARGDVLADLGHVAALGPVSGQLHDRAGAAVGRFTLSTSKTAGIASLLHSLTGAQVVIDAGNRRVASDFGHQTGTTYGIASLRATAFPSGALRVSLLTRQADAAWCATTPEQITANTVGAVAKRLFTQERAGARARKVLRHIALDPRFARAVATDDPAALRTQIVRFFRDPALHVVRIRASTPRGRLVNDVGGPYVLAPASATVRLQGRSVGRVTASIQDDAGYIKLVHRFTGAQVVLRTAAGVIPGSAHLTGPPNFSYTATRFPSGLLSVSLRVG